MKQLLLILIVISIFACTDEIYVENLIEKPDTGQPNQPNNPVDSTLLIDSVMISGTAQFRNEWLRQYLSSTSTTVSLSDTPYTWQLEILFLYKDQYVIVNRSSKKYLNFDAKGFSLVTQPSKTTGWKLEEVVKDGGNRYRIKHVSSGGYLNTETGLTCGPILEGWQSANWYLE